MSDQPPPNVEPDVGGAPQPDGNTAGLGGATPWSAGDAPVRLLGAPESRRGGRPRTWGTAPP